MRRSARSVPGDGAWVSRRRVVTMLAAVLSAPLVFAQTGRAAPLRQDPLSILTPNGRFLFTVEVADTPETQHRGLMGRMDVPPETGMLFDFGEVRPVSMWMRNTPVSLDMLFIRADGTVAGIAAHTVPNSETILPSPEPVLAVLELAGGTADRLGITTQAHVEHPIFNRH